MALLEVKNLSVSYGPLQAVRGIDLEVSQGQIVALLGSNGAGKSSCLKALSGSVPRSGGSVLIEGRPLAKSAHEIVRQGIALSPEGRQIFPGLSVEDNLRAGAYILKDRARVQQNLERVFAMFPVLRERLRQQAGTLSGGEQQMLAIGRALMSSPRLLLLDEPSLGLAPLVIESIFRALRTIRQEGITILIVEQNALMTLELADYAYVLELGSIRMQGEASRLIREESLIDAYLGGKRNRTASGQKE